MAVPFARSWAACVLLLISLLTCSLQPAACDTANSTDASPPKSSAAKPPPPYFIHFGRCYHSLQSPRYGNWVMTRQLSKQTNPESIVLYLDTKNMTPVAAAFGTVQPPSFPLTHIYFAYFNNSGVKGWSKKLDQINYKEVPSYYWVKVNGKPVMTMRDLKDNGPSEPITASYSLKGTLGGAIRPSSTPYKIEIYKICPNPADNGSCAAIPNPATVFTSPAGHIVWSLWSVHQPLTVNGTAVANHAWCPVQTVVDVP